MSEREQWGDGQSGTPRDDLGARWATYFAHNKNARRDIPWEQGITTGISNERRAPLIRSLQRFEVGESGEGVHLKRGAARTDDADYARAITLFIAEEQDHAGWLARLIEGMGGARLHGHWSDTVFVALRRLCGLKVELMVLLVAEMIAIRYYRALHEGYGDDPVCESVFANIRCDENGHVAFHCEYLNAVFATHPALVRALVRVLWQAVYGLACLLVMWDHRGVLRVCGVTPRTFWRDAHAIFRDVARRIFAPSGNAGATTAFPTVVPPATP